MRNPDMDPGMNSQSDRSVKPRSWRHAYPVLLGCLREGRSPSGDEIELVVARMGREIGTVANSVWSRAGPATARRRMLVAAARAALLGRRDPNKS
jgi:hypothetical protein